MSVESRDHVTRQEALIGHTLCVLIGRESIPLPRALALHLALLVPWLGRILMQIAVSLESGIGIWRVHDSHFE